MHLFFRRLLKRAKKDVITLKFKVAKSLGQNSKDHYVQWRLKSAVKKANICIFVIPVSLLGRGSCYIASNMAISRMAGRMMVVYYNWSINNHLISNVYLKRSTKTLQCIWVCQHATCKTFYDQILIIREYLLILIRIKINGKLYLFFKFK